MAGPDRARTIVLTGYLRLLPDPRVRSVPTAQDACEIFVSYQKTKMEVKLNALWTLPQMDVGGQNALLPQRTFDIPEPVWTSRRR